MQFIEAAQAADETTMRSMLAAYPGCAMRTQTWLRGWPRRATGQRSGC